MMPGPDRLSETTKGNGGTEAEKDETNRLSSDDRCLS